MLARGGAGVGESISFMQRSSNSKEKRIFDYQIYRMKILVTGSAGFIGFHIAKKLLSEDHEVVGIDNINDYYDASLKYARLEDCGIEGGKPYTFGKEYSSIIWENYRFYRIDLAEKERVLQIFKEEQFDLVVHLAAQAGVRYSIENPWVYIESNIIGTMSIIEASRHYPVKQLLFASSSSIYGNSSDAPFSTNQNVDHPVSLYAATKKSNELMAYTYSHLYKVPTIGLRLFTVYGPWGRPDMAYFSFTKKILEGIPIDVYNHGELWRDFTYIDDIVGGIRAIIESNDVSNNKVKEVPYSLYNIGNSMPVKLTEFIKILEKVLGREAILNFTEMQPGDVLQTYADVNPLEKDFGFKPETSLEEGLNRFVEWYRWYYEKNEE